MISFGTDPAVTSLQKKEYTCSIPIASRLEIATSLVRQSLHETGGDKNLDCADRSPGSRSIMRWNAGNSNFFGQLGRPLQTTLPFEVMPTLPVPVPVNPPEVKTLTTQTPEPSGNKRPATGSLMGVCAKTNAGAIRPITAARNTFRFISKSITAAEPVSLAGKAL